MENYEQKIDIPESIDNNREDETQQDLQEWWEELSKLKNPIIIPQSH